METFPILSAESRKTDKIKTIVLIYTKMEEKASTFTKVKIEKKFPKRRKKEEIVKKSEKVLKNKQLLQKKRKEINC